MGAAPLALGGLVQLRLQADEVVCSRTGVAQDDFAPLLTHLAVVLMVRLVAIAFLITRDWRENRSQRCLKPACTHPHLQKPGLKIWKTFTFLLFLCRPTSLVLLNAPGAVRSNRGAMDARILLLGLVLVQIVTLTGRRKWRIDREQRQWPGWQGVTPRTHRAAFFPLGTDG